jgi:hypothetical protein
MAANRPPRINLGDLRRIELARPAYFDFLALKTCARQFATPVNFFTFVAPLTVSCRVTAAAEFATSVRRHQLLIIRCTVD